ncbi:receptor-type tyrosine-protein phosphatase N2-like [Gigantopelta aegis]|uniref:receptor-type tyrosine-protein phosphatase N2-like n=1 Tax=Gigantopelta aegis TaxID=1735272 RepID=UPI001B888672|nr:receptor-type tyrosine-protein phosphatase N2-like [Gigantopelta aegis]
MRKMSRLLFIAVLAVFGERTSLGFGTPLQSLFPLGTIGCMLSDVCKPDQVCKDDQLFGFCKNNQRNGRDQADGENEFNFHLSSQELDQLQAQIVILIQRGLTWKDALTQCVLQNTLVAFAFKNSFNPNSCEDALLSLSDDYSNDVKDEISSVLQKLLAYQGDDDGYSSPVLKKSMDDLGLGLEDGLQTNSNKRDEFVQIHKYFDQSKGQFKRDPFLTDENSLNYLSPFNSPRSDADVPVPDDSSQYDSRIRSYVNTIEQLSSLQKFDDQPPIDSQLMDEKNSILVQNDDQNSGRYTDQNSGRYTDQNSDRYIDQMYPVDDSEVEDFLRSQMSSNSVSNDDEALSGPSDQLLDSIDMTVKKDEKIDAAPPAEVRDELIELPDGYLSLSPPDERTLEDLLQGKIAPRSLDEDQIKRLTRFVEQMVTTLGKQDSVDDNILTEVKTEEELHPVQDNSPAADDHLLTEPMSQSQDEEILSPGGDSLISKKSSNKEPEKDAKPKDLPKPEDIVKITYANIQLDQEVSPELGEAFLLMLADLLGLDGKVNDVRVDGTRITFHVLPNSKLNATMVAEEAVKPDIVDQLTKEFGITLVTAGIGKETQVEVKKQDNKYVVLTFIFVGCTAGVLLAVVVIYVVRKHARSKEKLAQLSATGQGNEASKDYQDLCRQRMQSKSSEKPEPLHAVSRVSSVGEPNVRSPSSRSSTSSWSEEPVASNMDISTGHIVLSYMEDHLKNQDRLDQEWEALCAYEADPSSTKIANDPANMRKNRYGDILPYDHSRVVLSTSTNVSGSDYINASFITDHDPRNPAFIATQGPLPHTVADFWQMVWEQGSVVIVMLTKLTENGSAMCHRYWPEEGSDLYHIYEVHLVSEHIWCDDYLVRSFYLKNLQTNETRTVTQFHFLTWPHLGVPNSIKALLDFRRKVNKSYRGRSCPIVVHCSDGCGRTGTYCLIDMVLNRMAKGAKEIDMAATLEHIRDQRMAMAKTKEQFQFSLAAVAEEVHAILKALPQ